MLIAVYSPILEEAAATLGICVKEIMINFKFFPEAERLVKIFYMQVNKK